VDKFPNAKVQIELVGSASSLVAERFIKNNIEISKESAILLCGAIVSNTLNFKGGVTTERDREAFEYLNKIAQLPSNFSKELFKSKSDLSGSKLKERILGDLAWFNMGNNKVGISQNRNGRST
jgi:manganese-dependent inorganic pyrophosphatase